MRAPFKDSLRRIRVVLILRVIVIIVIIVMIIQALMTIAVILIVVWSEVCLPGISPLAVRGSSISGQNLWPRNCRLPADPCRNAVPTHAERGTGPIGVRYGLQVSQLQQHGCR